MKFRIILLMITCAMFLSSCGTAETSDSKNSEIKKDEIQSSEPTDNVIENSITLSESNDEQDYSSAEEVNDLIFDENGVAVWYKGATQEKNGIGFNVYIENNTDYTIMLQTRNVSVNDFQSRVAFSPKIEAGKKMNYDLRLLNKELEKNGLSIDNIEKLEFNFHVIYKEDDTLDFDGEKIILTP